MNITKEQSGTALKITLEGRLDTSTAPDFEKELHECLKGITDLTLDCSKLEYISSAGLRVLLMAHRTMAGQGRMKLTNINEIVHEVLDVTGFSDILTIE